MSILSVKVDKSGISGVSPKIVYIDTDDSIAEVVTSGYLSAVQQKHNMVFLDSDIALVVTKESSSSRVQSDWYSLTNTGGIWKLDQSPPTGSVILPTTINHIATYDDSEGVLTQDPLLVLTENSIQAEGDVIAGDSSGIPGFFEIFTPTSSLGTFNLSAFPNSGDFNVSISNNPHAQNTQYNISDAGVTNASFLTTVLPADPATNIILFEATVTAAALASSGTVVLYAATRPGSSYVVNNIFVNQVGTNFSGGSGDKAIDITDTISSYALVTVPLMTSLTNARIGDADFDYSISPIGTPTSAGQDLIARYSSGTFDFTTGSVIISGSLLEVA